MTETLNTLCLGKTPARPNAVKFKMATYVDMSVMPPIPKDFGHEEGMGMPWGILGNTTYGDCVTCGSAHRQMLYSHMAGRTLTFNTADVLADHVAISGLPLSPNNGADMQQAASYEQRIGLLGADGKRHTIAGYLEIEPGNLRQIYAGIYLFGAVGVGLHLPNSAFDQFRNHQAWHIVSGMTYAGYHYVPLMALRSNLVAVTWGQFQAIRPSFMSLNDESIAYVSMESMINNKSPEGFDAAGLLADLRALPNL